MASRLTLTLLGGADVQLDKHPVMGFRYEKAQALLFYLAVTGRPQTRTALAGLLWGDLPESNARVNLSTVLAALRRLLSEYLTASRQTVALHQNADYRLDVRDFEASVGTIPQHATTVELQDAIALYRGDFLDGFHVRNAPDFEAWALNERVRLQGMAVQALQTLVDRHVATGVLPEGIAFARQLLQLEPWREEAHRQLMVMLARHGQRNAALEQFQICTRVLSEELDVEPADETIILRERIERGEFAPLFDKQTHDYVIAPAPPRHNVPVPPSSLIGRNQEVRALQDLLLRNDVRLVTLTGAAGVGKTRMALKAARGLTDRFEDGAVFVRLAPIRDSGLVLSQVAQTFDVRESSGRPLQENLQTHLRRKHLLLVLDNFEQVISAAPLVTELLSACPRLKVMVTSREVLHVRGEHEYLVLPLAVPDLDHLPEPDALARIDGVALFVQRAKSVKPDFEVTVQNAASVAEICVRLDGLPLAIELAAARPKVYSPIALLSRLSDRFGLLQSRMRDIPDRHRTLREAIAWSYDLLNAEEQRLFRHLAIFVGGCTLEAAEQVCTGEGKSDVIFGIESLVDKSLLWEREEQDTLRVGMLESIREFGLERLEEAGELAALRHTYAQHCLAMAESVGLREPGCVSAAALKQLDADIDNFRAVWDWAVAQSEEVAIGLRLAWAMRDFWLTRGYYTEGRARIASMLALAKSSSATRTVGQGLNIAASLAREQGDYVAARKLSSQCLTIAMELNDRQLVAYARSILGWLAMDQNEFADAQARFRGSLSLFGSWDRRKGQAASSFLYWLNADAHAGLGYIALRSGQFKPAQSHFEEALALSRRIEASRLAADALSGLGFVDLATGSPAAALPLLMESHQLAQTHGDKMESALALFGIGWAFFQQRDLVNASTWLQHSLTLFLDTGDKFRISLPLLLFAGLAAAAEQPRRALRIIAGTISFRQSIGSPLAAAEQEELVEPTLRLLANAIETEESEAIWDEAETITLEQLVADATAISGIKEDYRSLKSGIQTEGTTRS